MNEEDYPMMITLQVSLQETREEMKRRLGQRGWILKLGETWILHQKSNNPLQ